MEEKLTEEELLLLCNLIYRDEFSLEYPNGFGSKDATVRNILSEVENHNNTQQTMTPEEWEAIYEMAKSDPQILNLKVTNQYCEPETGARMACFVDSDGQAYAVFAGTGENEWRDFSIEAKEALLDVARETEEEDWWDCWYDVENLFGHLKLDSYTAEVDKYYRKRLDSFLLDMPERIIG